MGIRSLCCIILILYGSTPQAQAQQPSSKVPKVYYIRMDSIGKRGVSIGWEDVELYTNAKNYITALSNMYVDTHFFIFSMKGDTLSLRQVQKIKFQDPRKLYPKVKDWIDPSSGSTKRIPFRIYIVRPTESKKWYVKAPLNYWTYLDYSKMPQE